MKTLLMGAWLAMTFAGGVAVARSEGGDTVDVGEGCDDGNPDAVRRRAPAPRCENCGKGKKICCPDCSLWVGKSCVCDCSVGACSCQ